MTTVDPIPVPAPAVQAHRQRLAFAAIRSELDALPTEGLPRVNLEIRQAVVTVLGCMPEIIALAPRLVTELPKVDAALFTKLERYTLAVGLNRPGIPGGSVA